MCKGLAKQDDPMDSLASGLTAFLKTFGKRNAAIYSFTATSMDKFGWDPASDVPWSNEKQSQLLLLISEYKGVNERIQHAEQFSEGENSEWRKAVCESTCAPVFVKGLISELPEAKR